MHSTNLICLFGSAIQASQFLKYVGLIIDTDMSLSAHVSYITSVYFCCVRQLRLVARCLMILFTVCFQWWLTILYT